MFKSAISRVAIEAMTGMSPVLQSIGATELCDCRSLFAFACTEVVKLAI